MTENTPSNAFLKHLAARDFEALAATLSPDVRARMLLPRGFEEHAGRDAVVGRIRGWFEAASEFHLNSSSEQTVGARQRLHWQFSVVRDGRTREVVEQVAFMNLGPDGIGQLDLLCSGFQGEVERAAAPVHAFDAGTMGCADGLAQEFRRQLAGVPVGGSLAVVVKDPAAKQDLPSLARMLGQRVTSTEAHEDGRLTITVERHK